MYPTYPYYGYKTTCEEKPISFPAQHQDRQPGMEYLMVPRPIYDNPQYIGSGKLLDKVAIITGGDSGIGRAVARRYISHQYFSEFLPYTGSTALFEARELDY